MGKQRTTCPRCGCEKARPNAQGPDHVWCPDCGGLVEVEDRDQIDLDLVNTRCPVNNLVAKEHNVQERGRVLNRTTNLKGGGTNHGRINID